MDEFRRGDLTFDVTDGGPVDGTVVVLLHGYPENRTSWERLTPHLTAAGFRVVAPDQRGYSPRARPRRRRDYVLEELVADTVALIDATGADRVHLVGHDWGGMVGWGLAATRPDRVLSFTSLATPHPAAYRESLFRSSQVLRSWYGIYFQLPLLPELSYRPPADRFLRRSLRGYGLDDDAVERYVRHLQEPGAARAALNWYRAVPFTRLKVGDVRVPTLYVFAAHDAFLVKDAADRTGDHVAAPYRYEVLDRSHWLPEEAPDEVGRMLLEHFAVSA